MYIRRMLEIKGNKLISKNQKVIEGDVFKEESDNINVTYFITDDRNNNYNLTVSDNDTDKEINLKLNEDEEEIIIFKHNKSEVVCNCCHKHIEKNTENVEFIIVTTNLFNSVINICADCQKEEDLTVKITHNDFVSPKMTNS